MAWLTFFVLAFSEVGLGDICQRIILYNPFLFVLLAGSDGVHR